MAFHCLTATVLHNQKKTIMYCQSKEASILWSHHKETRQLPGERDYAWNNARCMQAAT